MGSGTITYSIKEWESVLSKPQHREKEVGLEEAPSWPPLSSPPRHGAAGLLCPFLWAPLPSCPASSQPPLIHASQFLSREILLKHSLDFQPICSPAVALTMFGVDLSPCRSAQFTPWPWALSAFDPSVPPPPTHTHTTCCLCSLWASLGFQKTPGTRFLSHSEV